MAPLFTEKTPIQPITPKQNGRTPLRDTTNNTILHTRSHQRAFGDVITNTPHRPVFKAKPEEVDATPTKARPKRRIELGAPPTPPLNARIYATKENQPKHQIAFRERKAPTYTYAEDTELALDHPIQSHKRPKPNGTSLSSLIRTKSLELQTKRITGEEKSQVNTEDWHQWNPYCFIQGNSILLNPRRLPLENAISYRLVDGIHVVTTR